MEAPGYVTTDFPWPTFHHDQQHSGFTWATAPATNNPLWSLQTTGAVASSPVVLGGTVYFGSSDAKFYAVNESSGNILWTWNTGGAITGSPAVAGGLAYVESQDKTLYALDTRTGQMTWSSVEIAPLSSSPTFADGRLFFGTQYSSSAGTAQAIALNGTTGATLWSYNWPSSIQSSPAVDQGMVFFGTNNGFVLALDELSGRLLWQYQTGTAPVSSPAVSAGLVYVTTTSNKALSLNEATGAMKWSQSFGGAANPSPSSPAVDNGVIVFGTGRDQVLTLNATNGVLVWSYMTTGAVTSSPAIATDTVLVGSNDKSLYAISLGTGWLKWSFPTAGAVQSSPALADRLVFFGSQDGKLYAVGLPVPILQIVLTPSTATLRATLATKLTISVTANSQPQNALLAASADIGNLSAPAYQGGGIYLSTYTAPPVGTTSTATITVLASEPGFVSTSSKTIITVQPPSPLTATLTATSRSVSPDSSSTLILALLNGSQPVAGATVSAQSTMGGNFSSLADLGNGNYTIVFTPPRRDFTSPTATTILVEASKPGLTPATSSVQLVLFGSLPKPTTLPQLPIVPVILVGVGISVTATTAFLVKGRNREKPRLLERGLEFRSAFLNAVDSAFEAVGPNVWRSIMQTVEVRHGVQREQILDKLEDFQQGLMETLGRGSSIIERLILKRLYLELGYTVPPIEQEDFIAAVRTAEAEFLSPKRNRR